MKRSKFIGFCACLCATAIVGQAWAQQSTTATKPNTSTTPHAQTSGAPPANPAATPVPAATTTSPVATKPLYDRLGGEKAITGITYDFVDRVLKDSKVLSPSKAHKAVARYTGKCDIAQAQCCTIFVDGHRWTAEVRRQRFENRT